MNAKGYYSELQRALLALDTDYVEAIAAKVLDVYHSGRTLFLIGNGGSASLASHMACDLSKGLHDGPKRLRAHALTDNAEVLTAYANDQGYEHVFAEQLVTFARPNDTLLSISASGNSPSVLNAVRVAKKMGLYTISMCGFAGGQLAPLSDLPLIVASSNMQVIEDVHLTISHCVFTLVRRRLADDGVRAKIVTAKVG